MIEIQFHLPSIGEAVTRLSDEHDITIEQNLHGNAINPVQYLSPFLARSLYLQSVHSTAAMASSIG